MLAISEISLFSLVTVAVNFKTDFSLALSETAKTGFLTTRPKFIKGLVNLRSDAYFVTEIL